MLRSKIFRLLANVTWKLSQGFFILSGRFELAADGEPFEWPTDWEV